MSSSDESKNKEHLSQNSQNHPHREEESSQNLKNNSTSNHSQNRSKSKSQSPQESSDPFFQDFYNRKKNRPRLSERIFSNRPGGGVFEKDNFVDDLRKHIEEERKMFFDSDPFGNFPSHPRGGSPAPGGAHHAGSGSPRAGRVSINRKFWQFLINFIHFGVTNFKLALGHIFLPSFVHSFHYCDCSIVHIK